MIVALHVATGALGGSLARSRRAAVALGPFLHLAGDLTPHQDFEREQLEAWTGYAALGLVAAACGPFSREAICAAAAAAPDLEHVLHTPRPGGRALFPSHRFRRLHRVGGISAPAQLAVAALLLAALLRR